MFTISQQQAEERWDILTPQLREALFSDVNGDFVWKLCQDEHLSEEKSYQVGELAGYVLYGFIHPDDMSKELVASLELPMPLAKKIVAAIDTRIFNPLRADIDKVYQPITDLQPVTPEVGSGPRILQGNNLPPTQTIKPAPLPMNKMAPPAPQFAPAPTAKPLVTTTIVGAAAPTATFSKPTASAGSGFSPAPKPATTSDIGWSKMQSSGPVVKLDPSPVAPSAPIVPKPPVPSAQASTPSPAAPSSPSSNAGAVGEFERLNIGTTKRSPLTGPAPAGAHVVAVDAKPIAPAVLTSPTSTVAPTVAMPTVAPKPTAPVEPPPMMLHEDTKFQSDQKNSEFRLSKPGSGAEVTLAPGKPQEVSRPAVIEFTGSSNTPKTSAAAPSSSAVHYTQFKPSLSSVPTANSGPRNVSQIVAPAPVAPAPQSIPVPIPRPPQVAQPAQPAFAATTPAPTSAPQKEKVIVKDFL